MTLLSDHLNRRQELQRLCDELMEVLSSNLSWKEKYEVVFSTNRNQIEPLLKPYEFEYYDPDTTYEEDAKAYVYALQEFLTNPTE